MSTPHYTQTSVSIELPQHHETVLDEASETTGLTRDQIAKEALRRLLNEIRTDKKGHYHAVI